MNHLVKPATKLMCPDGTRTVLRAFRLTDPSEEGKQGGRTERVIERIKSLSPEEVDRQVADTIKVLGERHDNIEDMLDGRFHELREESDGRFQATDQQGRLIAAYFSEEYSIESAALFNPSVVECHDQSGVAEGDTRFIMSLRGIGEGHISSLIFQTGVWHADDSVTLDPRGSKAVGPVVKLPKMDSNERTAHLTFPDVPIGERVMYPFLPSQGRGLEDARLCRFAADDGKKTYRGTFTAFDGTDVRQAVLETDDFTTMTGRRLDGDLAFKKGAAWFPRCIDGKYHMLARLDDESVAVLASDDPTTWTGGTSVIKPKFPWEFVQMGNCGSPIELDEGWLVLTHGVGKARRYCMGASLLDKDDPCKLLARTPEPLLEPDDSERGGYVPNVVYSCGSMVRGRTMLMPYGVADNYSALSTVSIDDLLKAMR